MNAIDEFAKMVEEVKAESRIRSWNAACYLLRKNPSRYSLKDSFGIKWLHDSKEKYDCYLFELL